MRHVKCTVREHEETGSLGLVPNIFERWFDQGRYIPATNRFGHELEVKHVEEGQEYTISYNLNGVGFVEVKEHKVSYY